MSRWRRQALTLALLPGQSKSVLWPSMYLSHSTSRGPQVDSQILVLSSLDSFEKFGNSNTGFQFGRSVAKSWSMVWYVLACAVVWKETRVLKHCFQQSTAQSWASLNASGATWMRHFQSLMII